MKAPVIESERLVYKPISSVYTAQYYVDWLNDPEVFKYLQIPRNYTFQMLKEFLEFFDKNERLFWAIHLKENDLHIGNIKIDPINETHGLGEYGIMMGRKEEWGKGYAKEASNRIIDFSFKECGLRKMTLGVVPENVTALGLYIKLRFVIEGVYKHHGLYDGKYYDMVRMALFNPDYVYE